MKHLDLLSEFRGLISRLRQEVEAASAMQLYDTHKVAEQVICGLLRELCGFTGIRNLNAEQSNFPGIDLADDDARVAVQVTATADLAKVKHTLEKFVGHELHRHYDRLIIYILTTKQSSYSQPSIDAAAKGKFSLRADHDIWDYQALCTTAANVHPANLQAAVNVLKSYLRGVPIGLADEDIDPPAQPEETLFANLLRVDFPADLHVAQLNGDIMKGAKGKGRRHWRDAIRIYNQEVGRTVPSAYVVHGGTIITFFDLSSPDSPYRHLIEPGTEEVLSSQEFYQIDQDHENVFKSLLRFSLQQRLFAERVRWYNDERQFVFLPNEDNEDTREEVWKDTKLSKRTVYVRKYNKKDSSKVFMQKHLAFSVDFYLLEDDWLMSITPSWFFSYGQNFEKAWRYGHEHLSWIKRQENNRAVLNHFRFLSAWLQAIDAEDLFSQPSKIASFLSFGDYTSFGGAPSLDESIWTPLPSTTEESDVPILELIEK